ncbi:hypothetical protein PR003_g10888 [Phytophthora rubi]|uniref:Uncharacterized protein n=1 Tax=Phytophthora rubi TaxID=129364 RepID=A0A6A3N137_9STRA|nr:hypothetical protein PR002_g9314 [Phytophthora rubi]KAE9035268.1 hypothetical protein PR001_g9384 [Phytophthora rubi]KAE9339695.1 hypothetical protein PR003_g10888 [Phytophthora rubi]
MSEGVAGKLRAIKMGVSRRGSSLNATLQAKDVRLQLDEEFERENGYSFDYVLVFQVHDEASELSDQQKKFSMRTILQHLARGGIETKMFYSADRGQVFCKLRATLERLSKEADRIDYKVEFDASELRKIAETGYETHSIKKIIIKDEHQVSHRDPYQNIFAKFDVEPRLYPAYRKYGDKPIPFRGVDRIKLLLNIVKTRGEGGCGLNVSELLRDKCLVAAFPLHDRMELDKLRDEWFSFKFAPWAQPLCGIKDYFGEKVGLYFAWLGHYTTWLIAPAIIGCLLFANVLVEGTADSLLVPYFGLFMALWSIFYYEYWKRYNSTLALEWGMTNFEEEEVERPEFEGIPTISPIDGSEIRYFSPQTRFRRVMGSLFFVSMLILLVIGVVAGIFIFRIAATSGKWKDIFTVNGMQLGGPAASTVNAIQIMVMNNVYSTVAEKLNRFENHRTDTEYEDHLIGKTFLFQFVNSYASLFYVAFIKTSVEGHESCKPEGHGCMDELMMSLGIIFILRLTSGNFFEAGLPWIMKKLKFKKTKENGIVRVPSSIEHQMALDVYDQKGTFDDYNEMIIQFGYVTLFVVSFPLAPAFALFNNFFEIRIDAHKLVNATRRPDPRGAQDIGTWGTIIDLMGSIAMVTNVALVFFTSRRTTAHLSEHERLWLFVCVEHGLILLKYILMIIVDDEPHDVALQKQRSHFIVDKLVNLIADDDDEEMAKGNQVRVDLTVFDEDI